MLVVFNHIRLLFIYLLTYFSIMENKKDNFGEVLNSDKQISSKAHVRPHPTGCHKYLNEIGEP